MITKKVFATTSSLLFSAILLSQFYTFTKSRIEPKTINYSALINLSENIKQLPGKSEEVSTNKEFVEINKEIIKLVEKEIDHGIHNSKFALSLKVKEKQNINKTSTVEKIKLSQATASVDLSPYEINNQELITLYGLKNDSEKNEYSKFEKIAENYHYYNEEKIIVDEIAVTQASPDQVNEEIIHADEVKTTQPSVVRNESKESIESNEDELVVFDYSKLKNDINQKLYERPLSIAVKNAINREMSDVTKKAEVKPMAQMNTQLIKEKSEYQNNVASLEKNTQDEESVVYEYSLDNKIKNKSSDVMEPSAFTTEVDTQPTSFTISAKEIFLDNQKQKQVYSFEYSPDYDRTQRVDDQTSGKIVISNMLSGTMNTQTGLVQSRGTVSTRVELNQGVESVIEIPLLNEDSIQRFLQTRGLSVEGNLILIGLNSEVVDTEIDTKYDQKFYFNKSFKVMREIKGASYVMYAGVKSGNILLRYHLNNNEDAQKVIYVGEGEMYFENANFTAGNRDIYSLTTRNLLGYKRKELVIQGNQITFFNSKTIAKKKGLNVYEIKTPIMAAGMRKYLELNHLKDTLLVGSWDEKEIEIPSNDFINKVMEINDVSSLKDRCIVQINLTKDLREIHANGKNRTGEMYVETTYLDKEGSFSRENLELAEKLFVVGDLEGQFNIKLDYTDGSTNFLKTFCSQGSYLVEQL